MTVVEIVDVCLSPEDSAQLWGRFLDLPKRGNKNDSHIIDIDGWVLGRSQPAVAVEVVHRGTVVRRAPITVYRPDVAAAYPQLPGAEQSGFRTSVSISGMAELELGVQAVLRDQRRVPLGTVHARRRWREADDNAGVALVSVVIPCYNQARFLGEAIESVLSQTYPHVEIVVVDDGSSDNSAEVTARYPGVRYLRQENQGLSAARNAGLRHSSGSYLVFLDADDRLLPVALERNLNCLNAHPDSAFAAGHCDFIAYDGSPFLAVRQPRIEKDHYLELLRDNYIWMPGVVMYRRAVLEIVSGFDRSVSPAADYDLYMRIARDFPIYCHDTVIAQYRRHGANMTRNVALMLTATVAVLRSQWAHVKKRGKQYQEAYKIGMRHWKESYGSQLASEVGTHLWERQWKRTLQGASVLLKYYPRGLVAAVTADPQPWNKKDAAQSELEGLRQRVYTLAAEKDAVQGELAGLQQRLDALAMEKDAAQAEATDMRPVVEELQQRIQDLATKEDATHRECDLLQQRVHTLTAEKDAAAREAAELRPIVETRVELQQRFESLAAEKDAAQRELVPLQQRVQLLAAEKDALQHELAAFQQRLGVLTAEKDAAEREAAELRPILEAQTELQRRVQILAVENDAAQREVGELQQAIVEQAELQRRIQELAKENEVAQCEIARLQQTVEQQTRYLDALEGIAGWIERLSSREDVLQARRPRAHSHSPHYVDEGRSTVVAPQQHRLNHRTGVPASNQVTAQPQHILDPRATFPVPNWGLVPNQHTSYEQLSKYIGYQQLIGNIREVVRATLPPDASVLVVSKGDDDLLKLDNRHGRHFPQNEDGVYAGYYPADSAAAIFHLETLRARGGEFLLFPNTAFWWLEHYGEFQQHLDAHYRRIGDDEWCIIYQLSKSEPNGVEGNGRNNRDRGLAGAEAEVRGPHLGLPALSAGP